MKAVIIIACVFCALFDSFGFSWEPDTVRINDAYARLMENPESKEAQVDFFESFPASWYEYSLTYGCWWKYRLDDNQDGYLEYAGNPNELKNLYYCCYNHMDAFQRKLGLIDDSDYCKKIVNLAIGGRQEVDSGASVFKQLLHEAMNNRRVGMWNAISCLTPSDQLSFWLFYWGNIVTSKEYFEELGMLCDEMSGSFPKESEIMKVGSDYANGKTWFDSANRFYMRAIWEWAGEAK